MDVKIIHDGKYGVHRLPQRIPKFHEEYGLFIISYGNNVTQCDSYYTTTERYFEFYSISHMYDGAGMLYIEGKGEIEVYPGDAIMMAPWCINRYGGAKGKSYIEDTICFAGRIADLFFRTGIIRAGIYKMGKTRRLLKICEMLGDPSEIVRLNANIMLQKILIDIYNENVISNITLPHTNNLNKLIDMLKDNIDKWWRVEEMAELCGVTKDHFRRVFKKHTGVLPKHYIERLKMSKATELLVSTDNTVGAIAEYLGYTDAYHFSKRFKRIIGYPPSVYRKQFGTK